MLLKEKLLALMQQPDYVPLRREELIKALQLESKQIRKFHTLLRKLSASGKILQVKKDRFCLPHDADLVTGQIRFRSNGSAILVETAPLPGQSPRTLAIHAQNTGVALHGDRVVARLQPDEDRPWIRKKDGTQLTGRVIRILQRAHETLTGTLKRSRTAYYVMPDDPRIGCDFLVPDPADSGVFPQPKIDDKVIIRLHEWNTRHLNPEGEIIRVLGKTHEPGAEYQALLHRFNLNPEFPASVIEQAESVPAAVRKADLRNRLDCRRLFTFTIDPDDAKDFDDALSIEELGGGKIKVGIHIADVTHYVRPGAALDKEARERGNSTYLVGTVIPMLPQALSNGICSLVEGEDRLTKSVFISFDPQGKILSTELCNTVINSDKRLTYRQAYACLKHDQLDKIRNVPMPPSHQTGSIGRSLDEVSDAELKQLQEGVRTLWRLASQMRSKRMQKGSLDFDMPEVKIFVDADGYADRIEKIENDESHQLIEEFMLAANETVARTLFKENTPYISRVHDKPDSERLNELRELLATFEVQTGDLTKREEVIRMLKLIRDHPQGYNLKVQFLRSLKQACYRAEADGHYGLNKTYYAHFTSPIRRYADLILHRIFDNHLLRHKADTAPRRSPYSLPKKELSAIAEHVTITEQNSTEAERESVKIKLLEYFEREAKKSHKNTHAAIVTDIKNHGLFVELTDSMAFGFVPVSRMTDDFYQISKDGFSMRGRRTGRRLIIGQTVQVQIERVDRFKRQMDFRLLEENAGSHVATSGDSKQPRRQQKKAKAATGKNKASSSKRTSRSKRKAR